MLVDIDELDYPEFEQPWMRIYEKPEYAITAQQEAAIREFAREQGFDTLRGFHMFMRAEDWTYYDILRMVSP